MCIRDRQCAAVDTVEAVGLHVVREAARAADPRDEHRFLRAQPLVAAEPLHGGEDGVVAAARAPARHAALVVLELEVLLAHLEQAFGGGHRVHVGLSRGAVIASSLAARTRLSVPGLIGWPRTSLQQSTSTR